MGSEALGRHWARYAKSSSAGARSALLATRMFSLSPSFSDALRGGIQGGLSDARDWSVEIPWVPASPHLMAASQPAHGPTSVTRSSE